MKQIPFTKMHGTGNDFIVIDATTTPIEQKSLLAQKMCRRHFGIGADQFIVICDSDKADYLMEIYNPDGSNVEMCGNALRAVALFIKFRKNNSSETITIETAGGFTSAKIIDDLVTINMGVPSFSADDIGLNQDNSIIGMDMTFSNDVNRNITCVSMGNPHCVQFVQSTEDIPLEEEGTLIENHSLFKNRTNVEFIEVLSANEVNMRVWERGTGETLACGSGACAAVAASISNQLTERTVKVNLKGGTLTIKWDEEDNCIYMTGPAKFVFDGVWSL